MKLIVLILGLIVGAGGGVLFSVNFPDQAAKIAGKENELIDKGKREAYAAIKDQLDKILADSSTPTSTGSTPAGARGFAAGAGGSSSDSDATMKKLQALRGDVDAKIQASGKK